MKEQYLGIDIDLSRDALFTESGLSRLMEGYMIEGETSPQHRFAYVAGRQPVGWRIVGDCVNARRRLVDKRGSGSSCAVLPL